MSFKWSREQTEKLIICIEQNPCIYHVKSLGYLYRVKKAEAFNFILKELQQIDKNMSLVEIKRKWKVLRTQYMQKVRAISHSKKSGAGSNDVCEPKLWCFQQLQFLRTHSQKRQSKDNTAVTVDDIESCTSSNHKENLSEEPPKKINKASGAVNNFRNDLENFKTIIAQRKSEKKYAWLGHLVSAQMEMIIPENQPDAAWEVQSLMRRLTSQSSETQNPSTILNPPEDFLQFSVEVLEDNEDFC